MDDKFKKAIELFKQQTKKDCFEIKSEEGEPSILDDKIGGMPYLPVGEEYPLDKNGKPLGLLLQLNLNKIDLIGFPKKGILEIFTDIFLDNFTGIETEYSVKYFKEGLEYQKDLPTIDLSSYIIPASYKISVEKSIDYMPIYDYRFDDTITKIINEVYEKEYTRFAEFSDFSDLETQIFESLDHPSVSIGGYADFTQADPRMYGNINKDECLFKLDPCEDFDEIIIGDAGILFALISKEDIKNCNFENALVDWDCC